MCRQCFSDYHREKRPERAGRLIAAGRRWWATHPGYGAHAAARRREKATHGASSVLDREEVAAILSVYAERDALTQRTGTAHEVDHVVPFFLGGRHRFANLQLLTADEHRDKTSREQSIHFRKDPNAS